MKSANSDNTRWKATNERGISSFFNSRAEAVNFAQGKAAQHAPSIRGVGKYR